MSEQWYCPNCGPVVQRTENGFCLNGCCSGFLSPTMPPFVTALLARAEAAESNALEQVCEWVLSLGGISTGHADTLDDLFGEVTPQITGMQEVVVRYNALRQENKWLREVITEADEKIIPKLESELSALREAARWRPIETVPEGKSVDIWIRSTNNPDYYIRSCNVWCVNGEWHGGRIPEAKYGEYAAFWTPVPTPPQEPQA